MKNFTSENNIKYEVSNEKYLLPMLTQTSKGTNYWDPAPKSEKLTDRYVGRVILQLHQILGIFQSINLDVKGKTFLDIGTGNGLIPQLLLKYSNISSATGIDPYEEDEHMSSWQPKNTSENLQQLFKFIDKKISNKFNFFKYKDILTTENFSFIPPMIELKLVQKVKEFKKRKIGAHELQKIKDKFDIIYCKAIEHIHDWDLIFKQISKVAKKKTIVYFKHRSFFSYLGAHRFGSIGIPWGHVLLNDNDYRKFVNEFHKSRSEEMINFFFKGLAYPRLSVSQLTKIAASNGFFPLTIFTEKPRYYEKLLSLINNIDNFWEVIHKNYPMVSNDEILSGMHHIIFIKS